MRSERQDSNKPFLDDASDVIDLSELFSTLWAERWLIAAITAGVLILAASYAFLATPIYQSTALVQVDESSSPLSGLEDISSMLGGKSESEAEIQILRSRAVIMGAIDKLHLAVDAEPDRLPLIGGLFASHDPELTVTRLAVPEAWMDETLELTLTSADGYTLYGPEGDKVLEGTLGQAASADVVTEEGSGRVEMFVAGGNSLQPGDSFELTRRYDVEVYEDLNEQLGVNEQGKDTGIVQLSLQGKDRRKITDILNAIADTYLHQNVERQSEQAARRLDFIKQQLPDLREQVDSAENALAQYRATKGSVDMSLEAESLMKQAAEVDAQISQLEMKQAELTQQFTTNHPSMVALKDKRQQLQQEKQRIESQIKQLPTTEQKAIEMMRNVKVSNELYTALLNKAQELKVAKAGTVGNVRIIDHAIVPIEPVKPNKPLVVALGLVLGLMGGVFTVFLRQALDRTMTDPDEAERQLGLPVYTVVPFSDRQAELEKKSRREGDPGHELMARDFADEPAVESLRSLRTSLQFAMPGAEGNVIAMTGPSAGIGKSFVTANLACVLAQSGSRVLLIDGDMRRGRLHRIFRKSRGPGLSQVLSGEMAMEAAIQHGDVENLDVLSTGVLPPNPSELLLNPHMRAVVEKAADSYDYVLLDTPPVLAVSDAGILCGLASHVFLLLKAGEHSGREVQVAIKQLERTGVHPRGMILNGFRARDARRYGYGTAYRYEY